MATWDSDWQERQQEIDEADYSVKYADRLELEREAQEEAESKATDLAWDAAKPLAEKYAESIAKAIISELSEAQPDALGVVERLLGVAVDAEWLDEALAALLADDDYWLADTVSYAVYDAVLEALNRDQ